MEEANMFTLLRRLRRPFTRDSSAGEGIKVFDRLQLACARAQLAHEGTGAASPEALQPLDSGPSGAARENPPAVPASSVLRRFLGWFKARLSAPKDWRISPRRSFGHVNRELEVLVGPSRWPATVTDLSTTGIGLVLGLWHRPGTSLPLVIEDRKRGISCPIQAQVMRVVLMPDERWLTCCRFDEPLDAQQVRTWT
jgi:hypothetical protein